MEPKILIVEDVGAERACLVGALQPLSPIIAEASCLREAEQELLQSWPDLVILDSVFPNDHGEDPDFMADRFLDTLSKMGEREEEAAPIVILVIGNPASYVKDKVELIRRWRDSGRINAVELKIAANAGWGLFQTLLECAAKELLSARHFAPAKEELEKSFETLEKQHGIVSGDLSFLELYKTIVKVASTDATILLHGESGTGKDLVARAIHDLSRRRGRPFEVIDLAARQTGELLEAALFGRFKGAFTGASDAQAGPFERANGGTVFLDEIADVPLAYQGELLRVLDKRQVMRLGGKHYIEVDVRFVAATNRSLRQMVKDGTFRQDLFYRLNVVTIELPPLRKRQGDIPLLVNYFLAQFNAKYSKKVTLGPGVVGTLSSCSWAGGNVREVMSFVDRMVTLQDGVVTSDWVKDDLRKELEGQTEGRLDVQELSFPVLHAMPPDRPPTISLSDTALLEELKNASSPQWAWLTEPEEEAILAALTIRSSSEGGARIRRMEQRLKSRKSRLEGGEGDNPRRIHHYKLLLYLSFRDDHAGHMKEFQNILGLGYAQTDLVLENLIRFGCVAKGEKDGSAQRYVLAEHM